MSAIDDGVVYIQVTSKPHRSPIGSLLVIERSAGTDVTLAGGLPGHWSDLKAGGTVEAGGSYDDVSQAMFDTDQIQATIGNILVNSLG